MANAHRAWHPTPPRRSGPGPQSTASLGCSVTVNRPSNHVHSGVEASALGRGYPRFWIARRSPSERTKNAPPAFDARMRRLGLVDPSAREGSNRVCYRKQGCVSLEPEGNEKASSMLGGTDEASWPSARQSWAGMFDPLLDHRPKFVSTTLFKILPCRAWVLQ